VQPLSTNTSNSGLFSRRMPKAGLHCTVWNFSSSNSSREGDTQSKTNAHVGHGPRVSIFAPVGGDVTHCQWSHDGHGPPALLIATYAMFYNPPCISNLTMPHICDPFTRTGWWQRHPKTRPRLTADNEEASFAIQPDPPPAPRALHAPHDHTPSPPLVLLPSPPSASHISHAGRCRPAQAACPSAGKLLL